MSCTYNARRSYASTLAVWTMVACMLAAVAGSAAASPYSDEVLADSPLLYWRMNETAGTSAANQGTGGAALDGTYHNLAAGGGSGNIGAAGPQSPAFGGFESDNHAPHFVPLAQDFLTMSYPQTRVELADTGVADPLRITGALSLEAWIYRDPQAVRNLTAGAPPDGSQYGNNDNEGIIAKYWGGTAPYIDGVGNGGVRTERAYELYYDDDLQSISVSLSGTGSFQSANVVDGAPGSVPLGQWTHVAATWDPGAAATADGVLTVYMNGAQVGQKTALALETLFSSSAPLWVGAQFDDAAQWNFEGRIDEVAVFNTTLSSARVQAHYAAASAPPPPTPIGEDQPSFYSATIIADAPKGYWRLGQTDGTALAEVTGNSNLQGSYVNLGTGSGPGNIAQEGPRPAGGFGGFAADNRAVHLDGSTSFATVPDTADLDITGALSMEAWIKLDSIPEGNGGIVGKYLGSGNQRSYVMYVSGQGTGNGELAMAISPDGTFTGATVLVDDAVLAVGEWLHVVGTFEPNQAMRLYVNGAEVASVTTGVPASIYSSSAPLWMGLQFDSTPGNHLPGLLDEVAVYDHVLSAAEVLEHYAAGQGGLPGDVNFDGTVDIFDVNVVSAHWGESGPTGDANGDMMVDIFDVNLISAHWGEMGPGGGGAAAVPEPAACTLAALACLSWSLWPAVRRRGRAFGSRGE